MIKLWEIGIKELFRAISTIFPILYGYKDK